MKEKEAPGRIRDFITVFVRTRVVVVWVLKTTLNEES